MDIVERVVNWVMGVWPLLLEYALGLVLAVWLTLVVWFIVCVVWDVLRHGCRRHL